MRIALCLLRKRFGSVLQREKKLINTVAVKTDLLRDETIDIISLGFSSRSSLQLKLANKINLILIRKTAHILSMPVSLYFTYVSCLVVTVLQIRLKILGKLSDEVKSPLMKLHNSLNGKVCLTQQEICSHRSFSSNALLHSSTAHCMFLFRFK